MEASNGQSLEDVFKKWEKKGEERRLNGPGYMASLYNEGNQDSQHGRAAWQQRYDVSALPRRRSNRKKHHATREIGHSRDFDFAMSEPVERKFQLIPPIVEDHNRTSRPFLSTGCSKCSQKSIKVMFTTEKIKNSPLRNLLDLSVFCRKNFFRTAFSDILYVANLPNRKNKKIAEMKSTVLTSPGVCSTIQRLTTHEEHEAATPDVKTGEEIVKPTLTAKQLKAKAQKVINAMNGTIKGYLIKIATWVLFKFFGKIMSSIHVHQGQIAMLHEASKRNLPLVYLPLHKSHVDYMFISFVLSWYGLKVPYIAAGDNLKDIPLFSWLMRNMGGFFIRRKLGGFTPQNELYRAVMNEYIAQILMSGNNLEIFIEGTRSRSGKSYPPKIGVLSSVISAIKEGRVSDVLIVPVNISYEKILETGYTDELMGKPKIPESFFQTLKNVWRIFRSHFGQVRVDFGLPFSLTEITHSSESSESWQTFLKTTTLNSNQLLARGSAMSDISLESLDASTTALTKGIARHVNYECIQNSTIMGTNMVAFLLLTKFRKGVELNEFANAFELLKKDILMHKRDYGFSGANADVMLHAIELLGKDLVSSDPESRIIKPILSLPGLLELSYYSNQVLSVFVLESVVACSIGALLTDRNISLPELIYQNTTISRRELLNTALDLCDLLYREFVFSPPCTSLETAIMDAIDKFIAAEVLNVCEDTSTKSRERQWANRLAISTAWSDNEESEEETEITDQEYKINSSDEAIWKLKFLRDILSPIIESYWFAASSLLCLRDVQYNENDFINLVHKAAISRVTSGTAFFGESCSVVSIRNAIKAFMDCRILRQETATGPMLMFERYFESKPPRRFYSCSACRDRKECNFFQWEDETPSIASQDAHRRIIEASKPSISHTRCLKRLKRVKRLKESQRTYCHTCAQLLLPKEMDKHNDHEMTSGISDDIVSSPSYLFKPLDKKKSFAQYLFSDASVDFLLETFERLGYKRILCIGTPRIHEAIQKKKVNEMDSILLDLDHRYAQFNDEGRFIHYNMFNHHFFEEDLAKPLLQNFFENSKLNSLLVVLDPPFGGLVEVLAASVRKIWKLADCNKDYKDSEGPLELPTFWIFPYFMESHIVEEMPSFNMCELKVNYDNHPLYKKRHSSSAKTSPVRIFTNVPLRDIVLPEDEGYRYCEKCERYVSESNVHCELCNDCTSKDGRIWLHCSLCNKCVKKGRVHCQSCDHCELVEHVCQRSLRGCHICGKLDHKRKNCPDRPRPHSGGNKRKKGKEKSSKIKKRKGISE